MNAMRILICATFAIIVAALVYTFVRQGNELTVAELRQQLLEAQQEKRNSESFSNNNFVSEPSTPSLSDLEASLANEEAAEPTLTPEQIAQQANELEAQQLADAELEASLEQPTLPETGSRAEVIGQALTMATVNHYDETQQIIIVDLKRPESIVRGQILGIRRNNGILGRVKLAGKVKSNPSQAFADPVSSPSFGGKVDIQVGDELIIVP